ncbi:MAG: hypothetical protein RIM84_25855, partial [Alphaproteobacteria bacterium]
MRFVIFNLAVLVGLGYLLFGDPAQRPTWLAAPQAEPPAPTPVPAPVVAVEPAPEPPPAPESDPEPMPAV